MTNGISPKQVLEPESETSYINKLVDNGRRDANELQNKEKLLEEKHLDSKLKYISEEYLINNWRNRLVFARDIVLGGLIIGVIVKNALLDNVIGQLVDFLTLDNGYMSQFALVSLLLGIVPVIMYSKKLKKESKEAKGDKKEEMDIIRQIGKDYPYGKKYGKNEEEDKDKFDK